MLLKFTLYHADPHPVWVDADRIAWVEETTRLATQVAVIHTYDRSRIVVLDPDRKVAEQVIKAQK